MKIKEWFMEHHTPAADCAPWCSEEGGWLWPTVDVFDTVESQFGDLNGPVLEVATELAEQDWVANSFIDGMDK